VTKAGLAALGVGCRMDDKEKAMALPFPPLYKPPALGPGSVIGLIAPGSPLTPERIAKAVANLQAMGFKVRKGAHLAEKYGYLAGTDEQRLADLHWAFRDPEIDAVWCARGGYGCGRLLPKLDFDLIGRHPKVFIGYSDVTALHLPIQERTGLVTFHGPVAAGEFPPTVVDQLKTTLTGSKARQTISLTSPALTRKDPEDKAFVIRSGKASGPLTGGNLSLLAAMAGTPYGPSYARKIVFLEDVEEEPYRIDRMLTQLFQATDLAKAAGIALGIFTDCRPDGPEPSLSLAETLRLCLGSRSMPVLYGLPFGHITDHMTLPYGLRAELDTQKGTLVIAEAAVQR
jgi:muramoyltetrapeptide carboxypeptidase